MAKIVRPSLVGVKQITSGCRTCGGGIRTIPTQTPQQVQREAVKIEPLVEKVVQAPAPETNDSICGATLEQWRTLTPAALKAVTSRECVEYQLKLKGIHVDENAKDVQLIKLVKQSL